MRFSVDDDDEVIKLKCETIKSTIKKYQQISQHGFITNYIACHRPNTHTHRLKGHEKDSLIVSWESLMFEECFQECFEEYCRSSGILEMSFWFKKMTFICDFSLRATFPSFFVKHPNKTAFSVISHDICYLTNMILVLESVCHCLPAFCHEPCFVGLHDRHVVEDGMTRRTKVTFQRNEAPTKRSFQINYRSQKWVE